MVISTATTIDPSRPHIGHFGISCANSTRLPEVERSPRHRKDLASWQKFVIDRNVVGAEKLQIVIQDGARVMAGEIEVRMMDEPTIVGSSVVADIVDVQLVSD